MNKIKLFPHQQRALDSTKDFNRVAYYFDMRGMVEENPEKSKKLIADIANQVIDCWLGGGDSEEEGATTTAENHRNHRAGEIPHQGTD